MGTRTPWRTRAWMLFCVTTRGRERIFSKPRDSAIVRMASMRTLLLALRKLMPLFGLVTGRFENNGICWPVVGEGTEVPMIGYSGLRPKTEAGEDPTADAPPREVVPL